MSDRDADGSLFCSFVAEVEVKLEIAEEEHKNDVKEKTGDVSLASLSSMEVSPGPISSLVPWALFSFLKKFYNIRHIKFLDTCKISFFNSGITTKDNNTYILIQKIQGILYAVEKITNYTI